MIAAAAFAIILAGAPVITPIAARPRYFYRAKRTKGATPPSPAPAGIEPPAPARVRTIPMISFDEFYRRVGL